MCHCDLSLLYSTEQGLRSQSLIVLLVGLPLAFPIERPFDGTERLEYIDELLT